MVLSLQLLRAGQRLGVSATGKVELACGILSYGRWTWPKLNMSKGTILSRSIWKHGPCCSVVLAPRKLFLLIVAIVTSKKGLFESNPKQDYSGSCSICYRKVFLGWQCSWTWSGLWTPKTTTGTEYTDENPEGELSLRIYNSSVVPSPPCLHSQYKVLIQKSLNS